jgi:hypothetical protein
MSPIYAEIEVESRVDKFKHFENSKLGSIFFEWIRPSKDWTHTQLGVSFSSRLFTPIRTGLSFSFLSRYF